MKNFFILIATIIFTNIEMYAQKCRVGIDPFTKKKTVEYNFENKTIYFSLDDTIINFQYTMTIGGFLKEPIPANAAILFLFENDEILELKTQNECVPHNTNSGMIITYFPYQMVLTKVQLNLLAEKKVKTVRLPNGEGKTIDVQYTGFLKSFSKKLIAGAQCMMDNLK